MNYEDDCGGHSIDYSIGNSIRYCSTWGIVLAKGHLRGSRPPFVLALIHGLVAATGLVTLIIPVVQGATGSRIVTSLILFVVAALSGFALFSFRLREKVLPKRLILVHTFIAVAGYVVLIMSAK